MTPRGKSTEYYAWQNMKRRCYDPKNEHYHTYGERGITVCDRWLESFDNFLEDMGFKPSPELSIDRINNDKGYYKENCRWGTDEQQRSNKSTNKYIEYNGLSMTITQWANRTGIPFETLRVRIKHGWTPEKALTTSVKNMGRGKGRLFTYKGESMTLKGWSEKFGINYHSIQAAVGTRGLTIEQAIATLPRYK